MTLAAWKKILLFGLFGAVGCLAGWAIGEGYLLAAQAVTDSGSGQSGTLISKPTAPISAPPPPNVFKQRLDAAGAKTGDVQISLVWFNENDLDLHCIDPNGEEISYRHPRSASGGELDVDANREGRPITTTPVENIYWKNAPRGRYRVFVNHYLWRKDRAPNETEYELTMLRGNVRTDIPDRSQTPVPPRPRVENKGGNPDDNHTEYFEFSLEPRIDVSAVHEVPIRRGHFLSLPVAVRRSFVQDKLEITAENLPTGVTAEKATIPTGQNEGEIELKVSDTADEGTKTIKIVVTGPTATGSADVDLTVKPPKFSLTNVILTGIWTALLAVGLCLALLAGQNRYLDRPLFAAGRISMATVIVGAVLAGFASGSVGQALYSVMLAIGAGGVGFVIGWMLLGGLLGWGVSFFVSNLDKKKASIAGLTGGLLGAVSYLIGSQIGDLIGRFAGAAALGFCIGLVVAIVEAAFRSAWLEVRFGERETITVNLGAQPVNVGGDSRACTVWARGAADIALRFFIRDAKVICEDVPARTETVVGDGQSRTAGTVTLTVRTGTSAAPTTKPAPAKPPAAPAPKPLAVAPPPPSPPNYDHDDGLPIPMSPTTSARPKVVSILDDEGYSPPPAKPQASPIPKPLAASQPPKPQAASPPKPVAPPKPPVPIAPPKPVAASPPKPPTPSSEAEGCPTCKRKSPGKPGARYCMFCDKSY
jgi:hypothetical protein